MTNNPIKKKKESSILTKAVPAPNHGTETGLRKEIEEIEAMLGSLPNKSKPEIRAEIEEAKASSERKQVYESRLAQYLGTNHYKALLGSIAALGLVIGMAIPSGRQKSIEHSVQNQATAPAQAPAQSYTPALVQAPTPAQTPTAEKPKDKSLENKIEGIPEFSVDNASQIYAKDSIIEIWSKDCPASEKCKGYLTELSKRYEGVYFTRMEFENHFRTFEEMIEKKVLAKKIKQLPTVIYMQDGKEIERKEGRGIESIELMLIGRYPQNKPKTPAPERKEQEIF
jgi:thiol-disulfide isomerase/thioredoxin